MVHLSTLPLSIFHVNIQYFVWLRFNLLFSRSYRAIEQWVKCCVKFDKYIVFISIYFIHFNQYSNFDIVLSMNMNLLLWIQFRTVDIAHTHWAGVNHGIYSSTRSIQRKQRKKKKKLKISAQYAIIQNAHNKRITNVMNL